MNPRLRFSLPTIFATTAAFTFLAAEVAAQQPTTPIPPSGPRAARPAPPAVAPRTPQVTIKSKHGQWVVSCEKIKVPASARRVPAAQNPVRKKGKGNKGDRAKPVAAAAPGGVREINLCLMTQLIVTTVQLTKPVSVRMRVNLRRLPAAKNKSVLLMSLLVPIGVYLRDGIALEVDGKAIGRFPYSTCMAGRGRSGGACIVEFPIRKDLFEKLKKGKLASFFVYRKPGRPIKFNADLKGFAKAQKDL